MTDEELIESLRLWNRDDAADRIEELGDKLALMIFERDEVMMFERDEAWKRAAYSEKMWGETEAKLAKAVEALEDLVRDCEADYPPSHGAIKYFCRTTLAEIKNP